MSRRTVEGGAERPEHGQLLPCKRRQVAAADDREELDSEGQRHPGRGADVRRAGGLKSLPDWVGRAIGVEGDGGDVEHGGQAGGWEQQHPDEYPVKTDRGQAERCVRPCRSVEDPAGQVLIV